MHEWIEQRDADRLKITFNTRWVVVESYDHPQFGKKKKNQGKPREDLKNSCDRERKEEIANENL